MRQARSVPSEVICATAGTWVCVLALVCQTGPSTAESRSGAVERTCGPRALRALAELLDVSVPPQDWMAATGKLGQHEVSLADLVEVGREIGLHLTGWRLTVDELLQRNAPAVVHHSYGHFSTYLDCINDSVRLLDGGGDLQVVSRDEFRETFSGYCLLPTPDRHPSHACALLFDEVDYDAGTLEEPTAAHVFQCRNVGPAPITVQAAPFSSACATAIVGGATLPPGAPGAIIVEGPVDAEGTAHAVKVLSDDPGQPVRYLSLRVRKRLPVSYGPRQMLLACGRGQERTVTVLVRGSSDLRILDATSSNKALTVSVGTRGDRPTADADSIPVRATVSAKAPVGRHLGDLTLKTNDARTPVIVIPATVELRGCVEVAPARLFLGEVRAGRSAERRVRISSPGRAGFRVERVECQLPGLRATVVPGAGAGTYEAIVELLTAATPGVIDGAVVAITNIPGEERVLVPVYVHVVE